MLRFSWQHSHDTDGIHFYRLYVNGRHLKTVLDKDGPGGHDPSPRVRVRLGKGRYRWFVRAYDYAGNHRTSHTFRHGRISKSSVLIIRRPHHKAPVAHIAHAR
jgi:hypothetical protein